MELFAIFNTAPRVRKLITHGDLQAQLDGLSVSMINSFMDHEESFTFDGQYKPDPTEVLEIIDFDDVDELIETVKHPDDCITWSPVGETPISDIKGLFFYQIIDGFYHVGIQNFDRRQIISNKFLLGWSNESFKSIGNTAISLDDKLCAVLKETEGQPTLLFKSLHNIRRIFDMNAYYHAATIEEINTFFTMDHFVGYDQDWLEANNDDSIRKAVTFISKEGILDQVSVLQIKDQAESLELELETRVVEGNERLVFPSEKRALKRLLRFIDEDIYRSPFTDTVYVTNSKRRLRR